MTRYPVRATAGAAALMTFGLAVATLTSGCGEEKQLPTLAPAEKAPDKAPAAPTASDPEAKAVIDRAVAAVTGGKPELLAKGKFFRATMKGAMYAGDSSPQSVETVRTMAAAWPDRFHFVNDGELLGNKLLVEAWLRRPEFTLTRNGADHRPSNPTEWEQNLAADLVGQVWMPLLVPPTDPKAVVYDPQTVSLDRRDLKLVKLTLGQYPAYQLYFEARTDALVRVEYAITEAGVPRRTAMVFADHKPGPHGLLLPHKMECLHNKSVVERWTVEKWEFPDAIPDDEFTPKKKP